MTLIANSLIPDRIPVRIVSVMCVADATDPHELARVLAGGSDAAAARWQVMSSEDSTGAEHVDVTIGDPAALPEMLRRWPGAVAVVVVAQGGDDTVLAALRAGATCIRSTDPALTAAYLQAVARRAGLIDATTRGQPS